MPCAWSGPELWATEMSPNLSNGQNLAKGYWHLGSMLTLNFLSLPLLLTVRLLVHACTDIDTSSDNKPVLFMH